MAVYALGDLVPRIHPDAYVHPEATIIGDVTIGAGSTVWPQAVLRGDDGAIIVGERSSIQDGRRGAHGPGGSHDDRRRPALSAISSTSRRAPCETAPWPASAR